MPATLHRRNLLSAVGAAALGGCLDSDPPAVGDSTADLPEDCPASQGYDVEWPAEFDAETAETFVEDYEAVHYRESVVEYEPETRLDSYDLGVHSEGVQSADDGYEVEVSGNGGIYRPDLLFEAHHEDDPTDAERVAASEVADDRLRELLETAAAEGRADANVRHGPDVDRYIDLFDSHFESYDPHESRGDSRTLYFSVDGTPVEVDVMASTLHGDYWWSATYYVDDHVVYRAEEDGDPKDGTLLECRTEV
ncbi:hypothetical protein [Natronomonas amylolytica]|uniref:hypothetical protein n=1 Tax=Natronomonas amylolytica TaxID=3108498 RepID=UPI0030083179